MIIKNKNSYWDRCKKINENNNLSKTNNLGHPIIIGCNYHTNWQSNKKMRFILNNVRGNKAELLTRTTKKIFDTDLDSLIFITTNHNKKKAKELRPILKEIITDFVKEKNSDEF